MNRPEAVMLCRLVKSLCPAQTMDEWTPDAWALALDDVDYDDAKQAVVAIVKQPIEPGRSRYVEPSHIRGEVKRIRAKRIDDAPPFEPSSGELTPGEYAAELRTYTARVASGERIERPQLGARLIRQLTSQLAASLPKVDA